jgi:hypothetical protein
MLFLRTLTIGTRLYPYPICPLCCCDRPSNMHARSIDKQPFSSDACLLGAQDATVAPQGQASFTTESPRASRAAVQRYGIAESAVPAEQRLGAPKKMERAPLLPESEKRINCQLFPSRAILPPGRRVSTMVEYVRRTISALLDGGCGRLGEYCRRPDSSRGTHEQF